MISRCAGCALEGAMISPSKSLVYGFPIDGPMNVLHVDVFTVRASINYTGNKGFLVAACGMCTFAVADPVPESCVPIRSVTLSLTKPGNDILLTRNIYILQ